MDRPLANRFLEKLPAEYRQQLMNRMTAVPLPRRAVIYRASQEPRFAYFMTSGMISVVSNLRDGTATEVEVVGMEGICPWVHLLGDLPVTTSAFMQVAGTGLRLPFAELRQEFETNDILRKTVLEFAEHQTLVLAQLASCNRHHSVEQRLARWLLMVQDRVATSDLELTQEFLAEMLGSRRTSVALAAGILQRAGLIQYMRGRVKVLDHTGLSKRACECYTVMRLLYKGLYK
jgi:CRP-like cAMP-binding protein